MTQGRGCAIEVPSVQWIFQRWGEAGPAPFKGWRKGAIEKWCLFFNWGLLAIYKVEVETDTSKQRVLQVLAFMAMITTKEGD